MGLQVLENKPLSQGIIGKSAPTLADITVRKSQEKALDYYSIYTSSARDRILARNAENTESFIIDKILDLLRLNNTPSDSTLLHSWELATMTRRQRAGWLSEKIRDAIERMLGGNPKRHFHHRTLFFC